MLPGSAQKHPENQAGKRAVARSHRERVFCGCCQGCGHGPTGRVPEPCHSLCRHASTGTCCPPGPTQLCHTTKDQALELSKVALAALIKLHLMRAQNSNHCAPPLQRPAVLSTWPSVPSVQWSSAPCSWGPWLEPVTLRPCVACSHTVTARCSRHLPCHIAVFPLPMRLSAQVLGYQPLKLVPRYCDLILLCHV